MASLWQNSSPRRKAIQVLLAVILFFGSMALCGFFTRPPKYKPKYQTIAHRFLDLEAQYVSIPDNSYELLDDVITEAKSNIRYDRGLTDPAARQQQLFDAFCVIDSILIRNNFIFPPGEWTTTLGEALEDHQLSSKEMEAALANSHNARRADQMKSHSDENFHLMACIPSAYLYMGIAQAIGFDLEPVLLPRHMFIRAPLGKDISINWDPNRGRSISDEDYIRDWNVADWQVTQNIYMNSLSPDQVDAEMYAAIGVLLANQSAFRGYGPAIECYRKALLLNPREINASSNLAACLLFTPNPDSEVRTESLELAQRAVACDPDNAAGHMALAYAWADEGSTAAAVAEVKNAIALDPQNQEARDMLPLIQSGCTMYDAFKARSPIAFWIENQCGWLYILIAVGSAVLGGVIWLIRRRRTGPKLNSPPPAISLLAEIGQ
jgi:tetratricopeptide (TPR) repeat protein